MFNKFLNRSRTNQQEEKQGFICPECRRDFSSIDDLSDHHIKAHPPADYHESFGAGSVEEDRGASVQFNGSEKTSARLKEDIDDLGISLQEESWYSAELQKELKRVEEENEALKASISSRSGNSQFDVVSKKAADLAVLVAQVSSELDEERSKSSSLEFHVANLQKTNEELCENQMTLQTRLVQSTSNDDVDVLKQQLAKCQVQIDSILALGEKETDTLKEKISDHLSDKTKMEDKLAQKEAALDTAHNENKTLSSDISQLQNAVDKEKLAQTLQDTQMKQFTARIAELESLCSTYTDDIRRKEDEKNSLFERLNGFNSTLSQMNNQIGKDDEEKSSEMKQLAANFTEFQSSLQEKESRNAELSTELNSIRAELSNTKQEYVQLESQLVAAHQNSNFLSERISKLEIDNLTKNVMTQEQSGKIVGLSKTLEDRDNNLSSLEKRNAELQQTSENLAEERDRLSDEANEQDQTINQLKGKVAELEKLVEETEQETTERYKKQCNETYQLDSKLTSLRNDFSEISLSNEKLKEEKASLLAKEGQMETNIEELSLSASEKEVLLKSQFDEYSLVKNSLEVVTSEKSTLEESIKSVEEQLEVSSSCVRDLNTRIEKKDEMLLALNKKVQKLEADIAKPCTMCLNYESRINKSHSKIQELETETEAQKTKISELEGELAEYQESVESNSEKLLHLEYNLEREKENAMNTEAMLKATRTQLQDSNDLLGGKVKMLESHLQEASNKASSAENANTELTKMKIRLEQELNETEHALKEGSEMHSKELEDLNSKNALLISHKMKLHEDVQQLSDDLEHAAAQLGVLREQLNEANTEMETLSDSHREELKKAESRIDSLSDQLLHSSKSHEIEMEKLDNELSSFRQKLRDSQGVVEELNKENERLYGKVNITEVTIENLMDERKLLQKSVLESEERNHVIAQENTKLISDLEKTQTTLNEIAQEHSHLLYTQARKQNRKWENDEEVTSCKSCYKEFGVSLRKHHCRNCGGIYCDHCSRFRSSTPSSKKELRVCGPCNKELNP
ncbi:early endosome antigen 1-like isoform X1 [Bolinopsis microptera]|uniref:early endosome antigen 1-like isoform X1 n=1 Tax=Bolinopsis microptera TaxID=2820187 RepID=UPI00307959A2